MAVRYGAPDLVPHLSAVYLCPCGRRAASHGLLAGFVPRGWLLGRSPSEPEHICPECARRSGRDTAGATSR